MQRTNREAENNLALSELLRISALPIPLEDMLGRCLDALLALSWLSVLPKGGVFLVARDEQGVEYLELVVERNLGAVVTTCAKVRFGQCLCGRVAQARQAIHATGVDERHELQYEGMQSHGHYNVPIMSGKRLLGVLVFYLPPDTEQAVDQSNFLQRCAGVLGLAIELRSKEHQLAEINRELKFQTDTLDEHAIVSTADVDGRITYVNRKFCEISGYSREELLGKNHRILKSGNHPASFYEDMWNTIARGEVWHGEICNRRKDGGLYWVSSTIAPFADEHGKPFKYVAIRTDITERKDAEHALTQAQSLAKVGNWSYDRSRSRLTWSDEFFRILGIDPTRAVPNRDLMIDSVHPEDRELVIQAYRESLQGLRPFDIEHRIVRKSDGDVRWVHQRCMHTRGAAGEVVRSDATVQDVTVRRESQEQIRRLAMTDHLTGLSNRAHFHGQFDHHLKLAARHGSRLALLLFDLDKFKPVNDTLGHQVGDGVLKSVAEILRKHCRETDVAVRWGGDEFAILMIAPDSHDGIARTAGRVITEIGRPMVVRGHEVHVGTSVGIAVYPDDGLDEDDLTFKADSALYRAKAKGGNTCCFWTPDDSAVSTPDRSCR